ncbi:hypothetical protein [Alicyclobacillus sp. ALC3]|uniref:hypothetical protein n=1 Tax=Alicyclobacillus sp. ALC3 TaxID=2796143 RepID=UPI002377D54D|nr:hypothetical protein [Alicyclobacillus sp. ALC3]WDL98676.1 hypothetical protein JC200_08450 [Alicyclobacillus sp. ALC3]
MSRKAKFAFFLVALCTIASMGVGSMLAALDMIFPSVVAFIVAVIGLVGGFTMRRRLL